MLSLATPTNTVSSYPFYMSFYLGDLTFRFWFKAETDENCWYPWNDCMTTAEKEAKWADFVTEIESQGLNIFDNDEGWETRTNF